MIFEKDRTRKRGQKWSCYADLLDLGNELSIAKLICPVHHSGDDHVISTTLLLPEVVVSLSRYVIGWLLIVSDVVSRDQLCFFGSVGDEWKHCQPIRDETDNCDVYYIYHYQYPDIKTVKVQKTKRN